MVNEDLGVVVLASFLLLFFIFMEIFLLPEAAIGLLFLAIVGVDLDNEDAPIGELLDERPGGTFLHDLALGHDVDLLASLFNVFQTLGND